MNEAHRVLEEFEGVVDNVYGIYLDGTSGFRLVKDEMVRVQQRDLTTRLKDRAIQTVEELDERALIYGKGKPTDPDAVVLHRVTQGELKARNADGGSNYAFLANVCVVTLYQYWEDHYRAAIADAKGLSSPNDLLVPIFGDLRLLRISITHHRANALPEVERCEILGWFKEGEDIVLDRDRMQDIIFHVKSAIWNLK